MMIRSRLDFSYIAWLLVQIVTCLRQIYFDIVFIPTKKCLLKKTTLAGFLLKGLWLMPWCNMERKNIVWRHVGTVCNTTRDCFSLSLITTIIFIMRIIIDYIIIIVIIIIIISIFITVPVLFGDNCILYDSQL